MWVLRRPSEITQVTCINFIEPFTIGRIECSFNITDDKSVSRRHASITFPPSLIHPLLTDCNSKFGTFLNGERVSEPVQLKHGDTLKFGGATSEFVVESKDFSVYCKSQKAKKMFKGLNEKYGIEVTGNLQEAVYFVIDDNEPIEEVDSDLISAFLSCKCIVSPSYFAQLLQGNTMSLGLIQPAVNSKMFPMDCWLPRRERVNVLKHAFEGIKRLIFISGDRNERVIKTVAHSLNIETKSITFPDLREIKFNELLFSPLIDAKDLIDPIRVVKYQSIIEALIKCDGKLIEIDTIYPEKTKEQTVFLIDEESEKPEKMRFIVNESPVIKTTEQLPESTLTTTPTTVLPVDYKGPSLTSVLPMPATLLRPVPADSALELTKKPKFVKCHPRHRLPGTIPALIGPDQLHANRPINNINNSSSSGGSGQGMKRRILVKDSWLAEDDLIESDNNDAMISKENKQHTSEKTKLNVDKESNKPITLNNTANTSTTGNTNTVPTPSTTSSSSTTNPNASKFQSSFFKNLTKGK